MGDLLAFLAELQATLAASAESGPAGRVTFEVVEVKNMFGDFGAAATDADKCK